MTSAQNLGYAILMVTLLVTGAVRVDSDNAFSADEADSSIVHVKSGTRFPLKFGNFIRLEPQATDQVIAVGYSSRGSIRAEFTEYIRTKNINILKYYSDSKSAISSMNKHLRLTSEDTNGSIESAYFEGSAVFDNEEKSVVSVLRIVEDHGWLIKIRMTLPFPQERLLTKIDLELFLGEIPIFYPTKTESEETSKPIIFLDKVLSQGPAEIKGAWFSYGMTIAIQMQGYQMMNGTYQGFQMTFELEREARAVLSSVWAKTKADKPDVVDRYLDDLLKIGSSGYISEYVYAYYRKEFWKDESDLRMGEFASWAERNIGGHVPQTLSIAATPP